MAISDEELARSKKITTEQVALLRRSRGATNETLYGLSPTAIQRALRRLNYPDMPRARLAFRAAQARDDKRQIAPNGLGKALKALRSLRAKAVRKPRVAGLPSQGPVQPAGLIAAPTAGIAQTRWEWLGPGNIGGRTRAILIHPADDQKLWAGSAGGGIWHTADGGAHWQPVDDFMANLAVSCMVMDPQTPEVMYAGTGEGFSNLDAIRGAGIFCTTDGVAWKQIPSTATADFAAVNRLAVSSNSKLLLAATGSGLFRATDKARKTWTRVLAQPTADVKFHPANSLRAVAGGLDNGETYFSTNGGKTWKPASHGPWLGRVELAYSKKNPNIVYASVQMSHGEI